MPSILSLLSIATVHAAFPIFIVFAVFNIYAVFPGQVVFIVYAKQGRRKQFLTGPATIRFVIIVYVELALT